MKRSPLARLRPNGAELVRLVTRETDPARAAEFREIARGPLAGLALLLVAGLWGLAAAPLRMLRR